MIKSFYRNMGYEQSERRCVELKTRERLQIENIVEIRTEMLSRPLTLKFNPICCDDYISIEVKMDSVRLALGALETQLGAVAKVKSLELTSGLLYRIAPQDLKRLLVAYEAYLDSVDAFAYDLQSAVLRGQVPDIESNWPAPALDF